MSSGRKPEMINTLQILEELKEALDEPAARKIAVIIGRVFGDLAQTVTKVESPDRRIP